ncbi:DtxR family Mn-dependent transcriptional regulator [Arthrobacter sp. CAN_A214]|uniref:metal-dependent transcriptional regulator n=1 Tax=Arthrobacter sp. CAN_A214 TaxID=2787720 RepID=UPI0018C98538
MVFLTDLSPSMQNYLKVIWGLQEWSEDPVSTTMIAHGVGVKLSTASDAVRKLTDQGLAEHLRYGSVGLTTSGRALALAMVRRHRLIESFLVQVLGYGWDEVHDEAEHLEHSVSDFMIERIDALLGFPVRDPHGDPIPSAEGVIQHPDAVVLTKASAGTRVRVRRISDSDAAMLQYFAEQGVGVDTELEVLPAEPYSEAVAVRVVDTTERVTLGAAAANSVWVSS